MATVREIAKICGVSPSTVSRVLTNSSPVREETRSKVLAAMSALQDADIYAPQFTVGIIIPATSANNLIGHPTLLTIITSFVSTLSTLGIANTTLIFDEHSSTDDLFSNNCDAYMIIGTNEQQEDLLISALQNTSTPYILINRWVKNVETSYINHNDELASCQAVQHFLDLGHKKIAFIGGDETYRSTKIHLSGYLTALKQAGIPAQEEYIHFDKHNGATGHAIAQKLLALKEPPTALYISADAIAITCLQHFEERGVNVPRDIAIISFGDIDACKYVSPTLSSISLSSKETGVAAAHAIQQMLFNPAISHVQMVMKTELVLRESSGGPIA